VEEARVALEVHGVPRGHPMDTVDPHHRDEIAVVDLVASNLSVAS